MRIRRRRACWLATRSGVSWRRRPGRRSSPWPRSCGPCMKSTVCRRLSLPATALIWVADRGLVDGMRTVREVLGLIELEIAQRGLEGLAPDGAPGDLALPRRQEIAAAINRLRTLRVKS